MFLVKEGHLNNSILEDSLLAYLLYEYTLYRTFIINIKVKCFYYKANIAFKSTHLQLQNFNEKFNLSLTGKLPIFLCQLAVAIASPQTSFGVRLSRIQRNECVTNEPQRTSAGRLQLPLKSKLINGLK